MNSDISEKVVKIIFSCNSHEQLINVQNWIDRMSMFDSCQKELLNSLIRARSKALNRITNDYIYKNN